MISSCGAGGVCAAFKTGLLLTGLSINFNRRAPLAGFVTLSVLRFGIVRIELEKLTITNRKSCPYFEGSAPTSAVAQRWDHRVASNVDQGGPTLWRMDGSGLGLRRTHP